MSTDFLSSIVSKMEQTQSDLDFIAKNNAIVEKVLKVDPNDIGNWEYRDRQDFELGDISALSESIETKGQAQPIIIVEASDLFRSSDNSLAKYVVIAGYRRWLACKSKNILIDAIVRRLSFDQAISCLVSENEKEGVSDYSKGIFFYSLLKKESVTKKNLYERLGINRSVFDNYLSFAEVPIEVWNAVKALNKVSARTSATIKSICQKGESEKQAIIAIADKIASGIGEKKINMLVNRILAGEKSVSNKNATRVAFSKNIFMEIKNDTLIVTAKKIRADDINKLQEEFSKVIENHFKDNMEIVV